MAASVAREARRMALRIMVVDDEPEALKLIKTTLEPLGHEVFTLLDSREAAESLEQQKFDMILVDVRMPHLDGFELSQRIRTSRLNRDAVIVMITGAYDVDVIRKAWREGVTFFITKPFNPQRLSSLIQAVGRSMSKENRRYARLPLRTPVNCRRSDKQFRATSLNISEGGMLLQASGDSKVGEEISLQFTIPKLAEPLKPRARVVRKEAKDRIAVEFSSLTPDDRRVIQHYISGRIKE